MSSIEKALQQYAFTNTLTNEHSRNISLMLLDIASRSACWSCNKPYRAAAITDLVRNRNSWPVSVFHKGQKSCCRTVSRTFGTVVEIICWGFDAHLIRFSLRSNTRIRSRETISVRLLCQPLRSSKLNLLERVFDVRSRRRYVFKGKSAYVSCNSCSFCCAVIGWARDR